MTKIMPSPQPTALPPGSMPSNISARILKTGDYVQCAIDPLLYLNKYAKIQHRVNGTVIKWQPWPYLIDLLNILQTFNDVVILKARQLGFSWLVAGYGEWKIKFSEAGKALYLSQGQDEAWALLAKSHFIWEHC